MAETGVCVCAPVFKDHIPAFLKSDTFISVLPEAVPDGMQRSNALLAEEGAFIGGMINTWSTFNDESSYITITTNGSWEINRIAMVENNTFILETTQMFSIVSISAFLF